MRKRSFSTTIIYLTHLVLCKSPVEKFNPHSHDTQFLSQDARWEGLRIGYFIPGPPYACRTKGPDRETVSIITVGEDVPKLPH